MEVITPLSKKFEYIKVKQLWEQFKHKLDDGGNFDFLLTNTHFFSFYSNEILMGCICFYEKDNKLFLNAFSNRKQHEKNMLCLKISLTFYNCDIYAECKQKPAIICLLKAGFKKIDTNLYKYERI